MTVSAVGSTRTGRVVGLRRRPTSPRATGWPRQWSVHVTAGTTPRRRRCQRQAVTGASATATAVRPGRRQCRLLRWRAGGLVRDATTARHALTGTRRRRRHERCGDRHAATRHAGPRPSAALDAAASPHRGRHHGLGTDLVAPVDGGTGQRGRPIADSGSRVDDGAGSPQPSRRRRGHAARRVDPRWSRGDQVERSRLAQSGRLTTRETRRGARRPAPATVRSPPRTASPRRCCHRAGRSPPRRPAAPCRRPAAPLTRVPAAVPRRRPPPLDRRPNVALAAPVPSVSAALRWRSPPRTWRLAAPLVSPSAGGSPQSVSLTAPNVALAAPPSRRPPGQSPSPPRLALAAPVVHRSRR